MENARCPSLLRIAATKAASSQFFLAGQIERFRILRGLDEDGLAQFLQCSPEIVPKLALCRRPNPDSSGFRADVEAIAAAFALPPENLGRLIREVDALDALSQVRTKRIGAPEGLLALARDKEEGESRGEAAEESSGD